MIRIVCIGALAAFALSACGRKDGASGPVVARVGNSTITAGEVKARLEETSPFLRARYNTVERKKEFLEGIIRNEVLAQEAERQGLGKTPAVREATKRAMIQELIRRQLDEKAAAAEVPEEELRKYYDAHLDDYVKPERARLFHILLPATDAKSRAEAHRRAQSILMDVEAREKKGEVNAFQAIASKESKDALTAPLGGDLRFQTKDEIAKSYGPELANAGFELKNPGDKSGPIDTPKGVELVKLQVKTVAMNRSFDESKEAIRARIAREHRQRDYDEWMKKLRDGAKVSVDEAELARVEVQGAAPGALQPGLSPGFGHPATPPGTAGSNVGGK